MEKRAFGGHRRASGGLRRAAGRWSTPVFGHRRAFSVIDACWKVIDACRKVIDAW